MKLELTNEERICLRIALDSRMIECEMREERNPVFYEQTRAICQELAKRLDALIPENADEQAKDGLTGS